METLDYASQETKRPMPRWVYWVILVLVAWPSVVGVGATGLYLLTWWKALEAMGMLCIVLGLVSVAIGGVLLIVYERSQLRYGVRRKGAVWREIGIALVLLIANFPLAAGCFVVAANESGKYQVSFVNETSAPVTAVVLTSNGTMTVVGDLPAGGRRKIVLRPAAEVTLRGKAISGGSEIDFVVDSYPEGGPEKKTVRFKAPATRPVVE